MFTFITGVEEVEYYLISVNSVKPPCSLWLCGECLLSVYIHHRDTENTEEAQIFQFSTPEIEHRRDEEGK